MRVTKNHTHKAGPDAALDKTGNSKRSQVRNSQQLVRVDSYMTTSAVTYPSR